MDPFRTYSYYARFVCFGGPVEPPWSEGDDEAVARLAKVLDLEKLGGSGGWGTIHMNHVKINI